LSLRSFLLKRALYTVVLIFFVIILNWIIFQAMPGLSGNFYSILGNRNKLSAANFNKQVEQFGLNDPIGVRFVKYVESMLTFQFGWSFQSNQAVAFEVINSGRLVNTLELLGVSTMLAIVIGILLGILVARRRGTFLDNFWVTASLTTFSLPTFFIGIMLIFIFVYALNWFPSFGVVNTDYLSPPYPPWWVLLLDRLQHLFLPALTLTVFSYGSFLLLTRATMIETLGEDYILTARAKGLSERVVLMRHAFKNASLPLVTATALQIGTILSGAIITETIFNWAGLGRWLFDAVIYKDFPVMQAMFYIIALCVIIANFASDVIYGIIDPRIKYE
jgi:peptide/nickel transport system permease protein